MDLHIHQQSQKQNRKRLTQDQIVLLERSFTSNNKLQADRKLVLARQLGLPQRQVAIWYQNRRARERSNVTEVNYKILQLELENVVADKRRLEKEVEMLRDEVSKAQQMLITALVPPTIITPIPSFSESGGDNDHASSSSHDDMIFTWEDIGVLPIEGLPAYLN
ncbi:hypothetical protein ACFE04_019207 [Oxalis oulophora]